MFALLFAGACVGTIEDADHGAGKVGGPDAGAAGDRADARSAPQGPELVCDDGVDDDGDGATDCDDADCAAEPHCGWPGQMRIDIDLLFDASSLAEQFGYGDCVTRLEATVADSGQRACATCDRGYVGPYTYLADDCPESPRPAEGSYGVRFVSDGQREVFVLDEAAVWQQVGMAAGDGGVFTLTRSDPVDYDGYDAGTMTTTMTFTDL